MRKHLTATLIFLVLTLVLTNPLILHVWNAVEDKQDALLRFGLDAAVGPGRHRVAHDAHPLGGDAAAHQIRRHAFVRRDKSARLDGKPEHSRANAVASDPPGFVRVAALIAILGDARDRQRPQIAALGPVDHWLGSGPASG